MLILFESLPLAIQSKILAIEPKIYNLRIWTDEQENIQDIDFYFVDDPKKDEEGYCGYGITEFILGSPTRKRLDKIRSIIERLVLHGHY